MSRSRPPHSAGWFVGAGSFWLIAAWLIITGLSSIIPQIFPDGGSTEQRACGPSIRTLKTELLAELGTSLGRPGADRTQLDSWLEDWDARLSALGEGCAPDEKLAVTELARLRHGLHGTMRRVDREQAPRIRKIDTLLGHSPEASHP